MFFIFCSSVLFLSLRGLPGNPTQDDLNTSVWKENGPLELSPERGRFSLTYSLLENKSFFYSLPIARFAMPDLGYHEDNYVSLFAPGISYIVMPGYILGKFVNASQIGTFTIIAVFAIANAFLIRAIAKQLGAHPIAATLGALIFLFASPAYAYAVTLYQHHVSTFLILLALWALLIWRGIKPLPLVWFLCALSIPVDYPNLFLMFPIGIFSLGRIFQIVEGSDVYSAKVKIFGFLTFATAVIPLVFFLWFNQMSYGNPLQFSGTVLSVRDITNEGSPVFREEVEINNDNSIVKPQREKSATGLFLTRDLMYLTYEHLLSADRGVLYFTPIMVIGLIGFILLLKRHTSMTALLVAIVGVNIMLYAMFGEGGWAFGSRYLIPSYAILGIGIAVVLRELRRKILFIVIFFIILVYSLSVNSLGALTTNRNPPKIEIPNLQLLTGRIEKYSWDRNLEYLNSKGVKSYAYNTYIYPYMTPWEYYFYLTTGLIVVSGSILFYYFIFVKHE